MSTHLSDEGFGLMRCTEAALPPDTSESVNCDYCPSAPKQQANLWKE